MSGDRPGGQPKLTIKKKSLNYPADPANPGTHKIEKVSDVDADTPPPAAPLQLKLGMRIKQNQTVELFEVGFGKSGQLPLHPQPAGGPIAQDLEATLGRAADERWATYLADYDPTFGTKFKTKLRLSPFPVSDNGFQVVTVAFTHANHQFATDNYVFGISLLPGKNNAGIQLNLGGSGASSAVSKSKTRKPARKKSPKRSKSPKSAGGSRRKR